MPTKKKSTTKSKITKSPSRKSQKVKVVKSTRNIFRRHPLRTFALSLVLLAVVGLAYGGFRGMGPLSSFFATPSVNRLVIDDTETRAIYQTPGQDRLGKATIVDKKSGKVHTNVDVVAADKYVPPASTPPKKNDDTKPKQLFSCCTEEQGSSRACNSVARYVKTSDDCTREGLLSCNDFFAPVANNIISPEMKQIYDNPVCTGTGRGGGGLGTGDDGIPDGFTPTKACRNLYGNLARAEFTTTGCNRQGDVYLGQAESFSCKKPFKENSLGPYCPLAILNNSSLMPFTCCGKQAAIDYVARDICKNSKVAFRTSNVTTVSVNLSNLGSVKFDGDTITANTNSAILTDGKCTPNAKHDCLNHLIQYTPDIHGNPITTSAQSCTIAGVQGFCCK